MSTKFPVQMTIQDVFALAGLLREQYQQNAYYASRTDADVADVEEVGEDGDEGYVKAQNKSWERKARDEAIVKRARYSQLHELLTGDPLVD